MNENLTKNYLSHYGIQGMKWGERNGPPYPLSKSVHNKVTSGSNVIGANAKRDPKTGRFVKGKKKKTGLTEKQKKKILANPKKIVKHQTELTKEEIEEALRKMDAVDRAKSKINKRKFFSRKNCGLTKRQRRMAKNPSTLLRNVDKFSAEDLQKAMNYIRNKNMLFDLKIDQANKPRKIIDTAANYIKSISTLLNNWNQLRDNRVTFKQEGLKNEELRKIWMFKNEPGAFKLLNKVDDNQMRELEKLLELKKTMEQSSMEDNNYLAHYGVKGMKWRNHVYKRRIDKRNGIPESWKKNRSKDTEFSVFPREESYQSIVDRMNALQERHNRNAEWYRRNYRSWNRSKIREAQERERQNDIEKYEKIRESRYRHNVENARRDFESNSALSKKIKKNEIAEARERAKRKAIRKRLRRWAGR